MDLFTKKNSKSGLALLMLGLAFSTPVVGHTIISNPAYSEIKADSLRDDAFLQQISAIAMKELLAANLAIEKGGAGVKKIGNTMVSRLTQATEEMRNLAKLKKITLSNTIPEGGQRADGRVDSAPENLKDTSRVNNNGGEAGNSGQQAKSGKVMSNSGAVKSVDHLKTLSGAAFDMAYADMIRTDRQMLLPLFENASKSKDKEIRKFAVKYLSMIKKSPEQLFGK